MESYLDQIQQVFGIHQLVGSTVVTVIKIGVWIYLDYGVGWALISIMPM